MDSLARTLIFFGGLLLLAGVGLLLASRLPGIGRLPGDLVFRRDGVSVYVPLATSLLLSLLLTLILNVVFRIWRS
jgi:hypothetical protein